MRDDAALSIENIGDAVLADLVFVTASWISLSPTSATLTPASPRLPATDSVIYGSPGNWGAAVRGADVLA